MNMTIGIQKTPPPPTPINFEKSTLDIREICDIIADKCIIKSIKEHRQIAIFWSGGLDSTALLVSLLKNVKLCDNNLIILMTQVSINNNKRFYTKYIKNSLKHIVYEHAEYKQIIANQIKNNCIFLSGSMGDFIFGTDIIHKKFPHYYYLDWKLALYYMYKNKKSNVYNLNYNVNEIINDHITIYQNYFNTIGVKIELFCEFVWIINLTLAQEHDRFVNLTDNYMLKNYYAFYYESKFNEWSFRNYKNIRKHHIYYEPQYFKLALKNLIFDFDHDITYYNTIHKLPAFGGMTFPTYNYNNSFNIITNDNIIAYKIDDSELGSELTTKQYWKIKNILRKYRKE